MRPRTTWAARIVVSDSLWGTLAENTAGTRRSSTVRRTLNRQPNLVRQTFDNCLGKQSWISSVLALFEKDAVDGCGCSFARKFRPAIKNYVSAPGAMCCAITSFYEKKTNRAIFVVLRNPWRPRITELVFFHMSSDPLAIPQVSPINKHRLDWETPSNQWSLAVRGPRCDK